MSKNQINYLLVLATLFVAGFYFNTFYLAAKLEKNMPSRTWGMERPSFEMKNHSNPMFPRGIPVRMPPSMSSNMTSLPPEVQKMLQQVQKTLPATPVASKLEEKK